MANIGIDINRTFVGVSDLKIQRLSDNVVMNLPLPQGFSLETGKENRVQYSRNKLGRRVRIGSFITGEDPVLNISYSNMQPEIMAFRLGNYFKPVTKELFTAFSFDLGSSNSTEFEGVTDPTQFGYGIAADQEVFASITRNNLSVPLTQETYAGFTASSTDTFAQGENGAFKFSDNLLDEKQVVSALVTYEANGLHISEELVGNHRLVAQMTTTEGEIVLFIAPLCKPISEGAIDFTAESMDISLSFITPFGSCQAYDIVYTGLYVDC